MTEDFPAEAECPDEGEQNAELNKTARNRKTIAMQPFSERAGRVQMTNYFFVFPSWQLRIQEVEASRRKRLPIFTRHRCIGHSSSIEFFLPAQTIVVADLTEERIRDQQC